MAIKYPDKIEHNNPALPILEPDEMQGGWQVVADVTARNLIPEAKRLVGQAVNWFNAAWVTKRFQGPDTTDPEWTNEANWSEIGGTTIVPVEETLGNNSAGSFVVADHTEKQSFILYYRADRGAVNFQSGQISIDYKAGAVHFVEFIGSLSEIGVTIDFNVNGNNIELDWITTDNVDDVDFVFTVGILAGSIEGGGGESLLPIYDFRVKGLNRWHSVLQIGGGTGTQSLPDEALITIPFPVANPITLSKIAIENTTNIVGSSCRLAIYESNADNLPGDLLLDCGSIPTTINGIQELAIDQELTTGLYWLVAIREDIGSNVTFRSIESGEAIHVFGYPSTIGAESGGNYISKPHTWTGSLPDPFPSVVDSDIVDGNANTPLILVNID